MADSVIGQILGPVLAALTTGTALLFQSYKNERRDEKKNESERGNARRKEVSVAREQWAGAYQEALSACVVAVNHARAVLGGGKGNDPTWNGGH